MTYITTLYNEEFPTDCAAGDQEPGTARDIATDRTSNYARSGLAR